ncbi:glycosyltransferase family 9 protein [Cellulophaga sp. E16_2]|uniref:glycosyltransferase family 9 protein n=1 Tax=unclassified Cellulophaga TaxID=2634405 RepID=UPI0013FD5310|nr:MULTISPECIES: glycosyltransferase family 9 protein [unclassified Cellulophaga]MBO0591346.1 glycosyltransferase family 9 protein [Cellulophaga sp. E16_2]
MNPINHILVIRLSAMGDVAMTVPVLLAFQEQYPEVKISLLTKAFFKPMFSQLQNVSIIEADIKGRHKGMIGLYRLSKELKALQIDAVADLHNVLRSNILRQYFKTSKIPFIQIDKGRAEKKALVAKKNKKFIALKTTHQRYADVFDKLGFPLDLKESKLLKKEAINEKTQKLVSAGTKTWIGIAPFAAFSGKMYPLAYMEKVVSELNNANRYKILLFGGGVKEKEILSKWENNYSNTLNMAGLITLDEELAVISQLDIMVAMDSGNAHLAAMYAIPTLTLWGVTHPYAGFYPFRQKEHNALLPDREKYPLIPTSIYGNKVPIGYGKVMETIKPEMVLKKIEEILH